MATKTAPTLADIEAARARLEGHARVTPVYGSATLSREAGRDVLLKAENLQRTGSFKIRGAMNRLATLSPEERAAGVVAASAGNHGQAVAWAAREVGVHATIFMPQDAPMAKVEPTVGYGAEEVLIGAGFEEALAEAMRRVEETGATFVHAFEDERVIAGQGTIGLELAEQVPDVDTVLIPVGGGGLAAGVSIALRALRPKVRLVGVEVRRGGYTIADGIAVKHPGEITFQLIRELVDDVVTVTDAEISQTIVQLLERSKAVVEGAGAVALAALLSGKVQAKRAVAVLSGGNIDTPLLMQVIRFGLTNAGRYLVIRTRLIDRPGQLMHLLKVLADAHINILVVSHHRESVDVAVAETGIELILETRDEAHAHSVVELVRNSGYPVTRMH